MIAEEAELGLTGKGVAPVQIDEIDKLVEKYIRRKEASAAADKSESEAKQKLVDAMHGYADQLREPDGALVYRFNETVVSLVAGAEKLKIEGGL
jgi:hypothetical protein